MTVLLLILALLVILAAVVWFLGWRQNRPRTPYADPPPGGYPSDSRPRGRKRRTK
jgi:hypothetical protein